MARGEHRAKQVGLDRVGPVFERLTGTKRRRCVVHDDADGAERPLTEGEEVADFLVNAHVRPAERRAAADLLDQTDGLAAAFVVHVGHDDVGTLPGEALRERAPATRSAGAGDDDAHCGSAKATTLLPDGAPFLPPPHAMTTNWRPLIV